MRRLFVACALGAVTLALEMQAEVDTEAATAVARRLDTRSVSAERARTDPVFLATSASVMAIASVLNVAMAGVRPMRMDHEKKEVPSSFIAYLVSY